jgi:hypothetical protein
MNDDITTGGMDFRPSHKWYEAIYEIDDLPIDWIDFLIEDLDPDASGQDPS